MRFGRGLMVAVLVMVASMAQAQGGPPGGMGGGMGGGRPGGMGQGGMARQNEMLYKGITLTDTQKAKIDSIQAAGRATMQGMMQSGADMATMRDQMMAMRQAQNTAIRNVLTAEQQAQFDKNLAEMPQGPGGMGGGRRPPPRR
ncbi:MAG: Spy/CpxP family protein refolding chaperone [Gemmatimonadaceae bacterium]|jgi:Spy/CpxP family protein refolding chaperone